MIEPKQATIAVENSSICRLSDEATERRVVQNVNKTKTHMANLSCLIAQTSTWNLLSSQGNHLNNNKQSFIEQISSMAEDIKNELVTIANSSIRPPPPPQPKWATLIAGSVAGIVVDTSLFPIDTIKSRLQSKQGLKASGGFSHLYRGLTPVLVGSIPNAAVFFITYETTKEVLHKYDPFKSGSSLHAVSHVVAASLGEAASCLVRVPYEIVKIRRQTMSAKQTIGLMTNKQILKNIVTNEGYAGFYRGFFSTIYRDVPFSALQFPIWEKLKARHHNKYDRPVTAIESALYGSIAGGISAFLTNPLDVAKSRIMLATSDEALSSGSMIVAFKTVYGERGLAGLFAGVVPRVIWISVGAAIFLGSYEQSLKVMTGKVS